MYLRTISIIFYRYKRIVSPTGSAVNGYFAQKPIIDYLIFRDNSAVTDQLHDLSGQNTIPDSVFEILVVIGLKFLYRHVVLLADDGDGFADFLLGHIQIFQNMEISSIQCVIMRRSRMKKSILT